MLKFPDRAELKRRLNDTNVSPELRIRAMNQLFNLPSPEGVSLKDVENRLRQFRAVLIEELDEIHDVLTLYNTRLQVLLHNPMDQDAVSSTYFDTVVALADLLADIHVYVHSEACRFGIPLFAVIDLVLKSQASKLLPDGSPVMAADGSKFLKGPDYQPPEPAIKSMLQLWDKWAGVWPTDEIDEPEDEKIVAMVKADLEEHKAFMASLPSESRDVFTHL
jgi:predicted HAD superfamily Cof-like phosphohydrolase